MSSGKPGTSGRVIRIDALGMLLVVGLAAAAYVVGVEPVFTAKAEIEDKRRLIDEQSRNAADAEQLVTRERQRLGDYKQRLAATSVRLEPVTRLNQRLVKISELVEKHRLSVQAMDPGTATSEPELGTFQIVPIRLSGSGAFTGVAAFVREMSVLYKDVEVRTLSLAAPAVNASAELPAPKSENAPGKEPAAPLPSFVLELRWFAAPAASGALSAGADAP